MKTDIVKTGTIALERAVPKGEVLEHRILFIHGAGHGSWMWKNFLGYFADNGFESWALNLRGHYLASPVDDWGQVGVQAYLDDIDQAAEQIGHKLVLVGHSMAGILILKHAESHDVSGLVVSQSGPTKPIMDKRGLAFPLPPKKPGAAPKTVPPLGDKEAILSRLFERNNVEDENVDLVLEHMGEESVRAYGEILNLGLTPSKVTAPVYILGFDAAKLGMKIPVDLGRVLAEEYHAKGLRTIEPGGHNYMLEKNWKEYAIQFETWIRACTSSESK
jgi:pimeloyl-ACP methyl ester carboxylesterase